MPFSRRHPSSSRQCSSCTNVDDPRHVLATGATCAIVLISGSDVLLQNMVTQAQAIAKEYNDPLPSAGDLFRVQDINDSGVNAVVLQKTLRAPFQVNDF